MTRAIILAHPRSGSNLLGEIIQSMADVTLFGETCNVMSYPPEQSDASFLRFKHHWAAAYPTYLGRRGRAPQTEVLDAYFAHLESTTGGGSVGIQVKYSQFHHFEMTWYEPLTVPCLLLSCRELGIRIVHLTRNDTLAAACSNLIGFSTRVYHSRDPAYRPREEAMELDVDAAANLALLFDRQIRTISDWLSEFPHFSLTYEALVESFNANPKLIHDLAAFLDLEWDGDLNIENQKVNRPLEQAVANLDSIRRALKHLKTDRQQS